MTYPGFPLDDSWIHQVFARNLASGHGFSFNPGQPLAGATAPLWTLLLAITWSVLGPIAGGIIPGLIFQWLAYLAIYKIAQKITNDKNLALIAAIVSIFLWQTVWGALSGMETGLFSALSLWGLYFYFKADRLSDRYSYIAYALFTLSFLARPECALFLAAALIRDFYEWAKSEKREIIPWIYKFIVVIGLTAPYFIFNIVTTGTLFPYTFSAKVQGKDLISAILDGNFRNIVRALTIHPYFYLQHFYRKIISSNYIIVLVAFAGILKLLFHDGNLRSKTVMLGILFFLYAPLMGVFSPMFSASFQHFRYATNLLPILALMGTLGLFWHKAIDLKMFSRKLLVVCTLFMATGLILRLAFRYFAPYLIPYIVDSGISIHSDQYEYMVGIVSRVGTGTFLLGILLLFGYKLNTESISSIIHGRVWRRILVSLTIFVGAVITIINAQTYANNTRNINEADVEAARFLGDIAEDGDVAAVNDIGSFGYFSNMEIFDLWGLVNKELDYSVLENDSMVFEYMYENKRVDYMAIFPGWFDYLSSRTDIFKPLRAFVSENNTILAEDSTVVYEAIWPDSLMRSQDFLHDVPTAGKLPDSGLWEK